MRLQHEEVFLSLPYIEVSLYRSKRSMRFDFGYGAADLFSAEGQLSFSSPSGSRRYCCAHPWPVPFADFPRVSPLSNHFSLLPMVIDSTKVTPWKETLHLLQKRSLTHHFMLAMPTVDRLDDLIRMVANPKKLKIFRRNVSAFQPRGFEPIQEPRPIDAVV